MRRTGFLLLATLALAGCGTRAAPPAAVPAAPIVTAPERPLPQEIEYSPAFRRALAAGTRTTTGEPGPKYWQNWTDYDLRARVFPAEKRLEGSGAIVYHNRSPHTLDRLHLDLHQNLHAPGSPRLEIVEVTGGVRLKRVAVAGQELEPNASGGARYEVWGTRLVVVPPQPVAPGDSVRLAIEWEFQIPRAGAGGRMGYDAEELLYLAYWYPQMTVFDDILRWHPDPFLGPAEFYAGFGDYRLTVEAPAGWVVAGTGALANAEEVLAPGVVERLRRAAASDSVLRVVNAAEMGPTTTRAGEAGRLSWSFRADSVRDVAFAVMRGYNWDAARAEVGDRDGDGTTDYTRVDAFWRPSAPLWDDEARYEQHAISFLSEFTGFPYPWPHMTAVEGGNILDGGMEYPMMTLMGDYNARGDSALYWVTAHELAHMWIPMIVSTDERRYGWLDEGSTAFAENQARKDFHPGFDHDDPDRQSYVEYARTGAEGPILRRTDYHYPGFARGVATYPKPATALVVLRELLGEEVFLRAYRTFIDRWAYKHPQPYDLWNTFEDVSGQDLDWFWDAWYDETWVLDQAVAEVEPVAGGTRITIADRGDMPLPALVRVTRAGGETLDRVIPVDVWLAGNRAAVVMVPAGPPVVRVEIDPEGVMPDVDRRNNVWVAEDS